jgi:hypothetical protein
MFWAGASVVHCAEAVSLASQNGKSDMKIGYRCWFLDCDDEDPALRSLLAESLWTGPVYECERPIADEQIGDVYEFGEERRNYGIHSYKSPELIDAAVESEGIGGLLVGVVNNYGLVRIHKNGFRSQYSQILALSRNIKCDVVTRDKHGAATVCSDRADHYITSIFSCDNHVETLRDAYGIYSDRLPIMDLDDIFKGLAKRYHCDIIDSNELYTYEERFRNGSW